MGKGQGAVSEISAHQESEGNGGENVGLIGFQR